MVNNNCHTRYECPYCNSEYGEYIDAEDCRDVNKMILNSDKFCITAAYCNGKAAFKEGIKMLSDGTHFIMVEDFAAYCEKLLEDN